MAKTLEEQYIDYLHSILDIQRWHYTEVNHYNYQYGDISKFFLENLKLKTLSAFDGNGLAEAVDVRGRKGYIDLTGKFFTEEELKEAEQSQNYIRFASGAKSSQNGEPLLYLTNFETEMDKACTQYQDSNLIGEDEFDLSGNPENDVPPNTHLLPSPKTGKWYVVTKYGSVFLESSQEISTRGGIFLLRPNKQNPTFRIFDMAGHQKVSSYNDGDVTYLGGYSKNWDQPFRSLFRYNASDDYCVYSYYDTALALTPSEIQDEEKVKEALKPTKKNRLFFSKYYWDANKSITDTVKVNNYQTEYLYVSESGETRRPERGPTYQFQSFKNITPTWLTKDLFFRREPRIEFYSSMRHFYFSKSDVVYKFRLPDDTKNVSISLEDEAAVPFLITDTDSYYNLNGQLFVLNNDLLGVDSEKNPEEEIVLMIKKDKKTNIIPFSDFTGFESNEPEEEELPLLEQIQKQTDDELKLSLAEKLAELERLLGEIRIYRETLASRNIKSPKRTTVSDDQLFIQVGDHLEILPWYLENELLPVINLSSNSFDNVKVSGIDFTGTNANIDPQTVYNKDMSHGIYDGLNFTMKNFDGVNTDDASFEGCVMDFAKNTPQTRKKSDNSFQKKI